MKAMIVVGSILFGVGLSGRAIIAVSAASVAMTSDSLSSDDMNQIKEKRKKSDTYKWIAFTGGMLIIGSRIGLRIQRNR